MLVLPHAADALGIESVKFLGQGLSVQGLIARIINGLLGLMGTLSLAYFVYGGATWMTSQGNEEKIKKGKKTIIWAVLGVSMTFVAYAGVKMVLDYLE